MFLNFALGIIIKSCKFNAIFLCRYPKFGEVLTRSTIGASVLITTPAFCGQLGLIYLFEDAMSAEQAKGVFSLGPDYIY